MEKKLVILFAYLKHIGVISGSLYYTMDRSNIDDHNDKIYATLYDGEVKQIKLPSFILTIIEQTIDYYNDEFYKYNDYEYDDYWYLYIFLDVVNKEITFKSKCRDEILNNFELELTIEDLTDMSSVRAVKELTNNGEIKIDFKYEGGYDDGTIWDVYHDDKYINGVDDHDYWQIANDIMAKEFGKWWNGEHGNVGEIRIWGNDIFVWGNERNLEYVDTKLNLKIKI